MRSTVNQILEKLGLLGVVRPVWRLVWRMICRVRSVKPFLQCECAQMRISRTIRALRKKERVRVAFLVVFDSVFHFERLFRLMLKDPYFDPMIVVIPEVDRGEAWGARQYGQVLESLKRKHGDRVIGYCEGGEPIKVEETSDLCVVLNMYDGLTLPQYGIAHLGSRGIPVVAANYGCDTGMHFAKGAFGASNYAYLWRYYSGTKLYHQLILSRQPNLQLHRRVRYSGAVKMDFLSEVPERPRNRKRVLVCPHHSIEGSSALALSNFRQYSELIQQLPVKYPEIDWVFRPHPLLKSAMQRHGGWTELDWDTYIDRLCRNTNVKYAPTGDCYDMFVNSDGMIQDCSSFLAEYHYTGHPQCYLLKSEQHAKSQYMEWGLELLSHTYKAFSDADIYRFVDEVILAGNDAKKPARLAFVKEKMCHNYPHVNEWVLNDIKKALGRK